MKTELVHKIYKDLDKQNMLSVISLYRRRLKSGRKYFIVSVKFRTAIGKQYSRRENYDCYEIALKHFFQNACNF